MLPASVLYYGPPFYTFYLFKWKGGFSYYIQWLGFTQATMSTPTILHTHSLSLLHTHTHTDKSPGGSIFVSFADPTGGSRALEMSVVFKVKWTKECFFLSPLLPLSFSLVFLSIFTFSLSQPLPIAEKVTYCLQWWGAERAPGGGRRLLGDTGRTLIRGCAFPVWVAARGEDGSGPRGAKRGRHWHPVMQKRCCLMQSCPVLNGL